MIRSVAEFIRYFEGVRRRTWTAVDRLTPELAGWRPRPDEFTAGAIVRHLAGAEHYGYRIEDVVARVRGGTARIC